MLPFTIAFYGYKGGVGRSHLAANIAALCARRGKTLFWDLNIGVPGAHYIPGLESSGPINTGFFEWLIGWQESCKSAENADFGKLIETAYQVEASENLFVLPTFGTGKDFADLQMAVRWEDFLVRDLFSGIVLFRKAMEAFGAAGFETVILLPGTGITDIGGLVACLLPHVTVLVGGYGRQNVSGLSSVWKALEPAVVGKIKPRAPLPDLKRILVLSPVNVNNANHTRLFPEWREAFGLGETEEVIVIPFEMELTSVEGVYIITNTASPVVKAYEALAGRIEEIRNDGTS